MKRLALELAIAASTSMELPQHNQGIFIVDIAKQFESYLDQEKNPTIIEQLKHAEYIAELYQAEHERIWELMPELRNTESYYELFEAVQTKQNLLRGLAE
jgi:hypothetical protein